MLQVARPARPEHAQRAEHIIDERERRGQLEQSQVFLRRADDIAAIVELVAQAATRL
jgi:hypothetical protein